MLCSLAFILLRYSNNFILATLLSMTTVAIYGLSNRLTNFIMMLQMKIVEVAYPILSHSFHQGNSEATRNYLMYFSALLLFIALLMSSVFYLNLQPIIHFLSSGKIDYLVALPVTIALLIQTCTMAAQSISVQYMLVSGQHRSISWINVVTTIITIAISYAMTAKYGFNGLIVGLLFPQVLVQLFMIIPLACRHAGLSLWRFWGEMLRMVLTPILLAWGATAVLLQVLPTAVGKLEILLRLALSASVLLLVSMATVYILMPSTQRLWVYESVWLPARRRFERMLPSS